MALLFGMTFMLRGIERSKCGSPVDCCSIPARRDRHLFKSIPRSVVQEFDPPPNFITGKYLLSSLSPKGVLQNELQHAPKTNVILSD